MLWPVACLNYLDRLMITTMRDSIKAEITMTDAQFGLLTSVFLWVYAGLSPFAGFLADRFSRSRLIIGSLFVWSAVTWLTAHANTFNELLLARALMGISEACYIPAAVALITDYHLGPTRSLATGLHMSGLYGGAALGGLGGFLAERFRWQTAFTFFGVVGLGYGLLLVFTLRDAGRGTSETQHAPQPQVRLGSVLACLAQRGSFWLLLTYFTLLSVAYWAIYGWLPTYLGEHFRLGQGSAGLSATAYLQTASFAGVLVGGFWADRWSRTNVRGRIFVPVLGFCGAGPALFLAASTDVLALAIGGLIVFGTARGFADANNMPILCQITERRYRATAYGVMNFMSCIAGGLMTYAAGALKDSQVGLHKVFQYSAIGVVIAVLLLLLIKPKKELEQT
jgi:MFS transporter, Spinster family, sphingosine-1-phosphate transporter